MQEVTEYVLGKDRYSFGVTDEQWFRNCLDSVTLGKQKLSLYALRMYPAKENCLAVAGLLCKYETRRTLLDVIRSLPEVSRFASHEKDWAFILYIYFNASLAQGRHNLFLRVPLQEDILGPWYTVDAVRKKYLSNTTEDKAIRDLGVYVCVTLCSYEDVLVYAADLELVFDRPFDESDVQNMAERFSLPNVNIEYDKCENALLFKKGSEFRAPGNYYTTKVNA